MISTEALIAKFQQALNEGWGYIWGAAGETWTKAKQDAATREATVKYGAKWIGKRVADCSGLFTWAFKEFGSSMYHGSNTMYNSWCVNKGELKNGCRKDGNELQPGTALFKYGLSDGKYCYYHVGLYVGNNVVIEARGTQSGVVTSAPSAWTHWGELKDVAYIPVPPPAPLEGKAKVTAPSGKTVNLRKSASTSASLVTAVPIGAEVEVIKDDGAWCKITYTNVKTGYMLKKFLKGES